MNSDMTWELDLEECLAVEEPTNKLSKPKEKLVENFTEIFRFDIAKQLINSGFRILRIVTNPNNNKDMYHFESSPELQIKLKEIRIKLIENS